MRTTTNVRRRATAVAITIGLIAISLMAEGSAAAAAEIPSAGPTVDAQTTAAPSLAGPPRDLAVDGRVGAATVTWSPPADPGASAVTGYLVSATSTDDTCETTQLTCELTGLPADGRDVTMSVVAVNADGAGQVATIVAHGTRIELTVAPNDVVHGASVRASGSVTSTAPALPVGLVVDLEEKSPWESTWRALDRLTVDSSARFTKVFAPRATELVRASINGGPGRIGGIATSPLVTVHRGLSLTSTGGRVHLGSKVTFSGRLTTPHPTARIALQTYSRGRWVHVQYTRADSASRFAIVRTLMVSDTTSWRVVAAPTTALAGGVSPVVRVAVTASLNSVVGRVSRSDVQYSWRPGCPVHYTNLRSMTFNYWNLGGGFERGTLIIDKGSVTHVRSAFHAAFVARFPIRSVIPVEAYYKGGTRSGTSADIASMSAGNTTGFNCRAVVGHAHRQSSHSWGSSIDVNPIENPYLTGGRVYPTAGKAYVNRANRRPGMLFRTSALVVSLRNNGWTWWGGKGDFQHISRSGG